MHVKLVLMVGISPGEGEVLISAGNGSLSNDRQRAYLSEMVLQIPKVFDQTLSPPKFQAFVDEAVIAGVPRADILELLKSKKVPYVEKDQRQTLTSEIIANLKQAAYRLEKEYQTAEGEVLPWESAGTPTDLMSERLKLPDEVGQRFRAHGIAKVSIGAQLDSLLTLLTDGIDSSKLFHTADLYRSDENEIAGAVGAAGPYDTGGFIVLGEPKQLHQSVGKEQEISATGIAGVLVNREWYDAVPTLQQAFPKIKFIRADQMRTFLVDWLAKIDTKD